MSMRRPAGRKHGQSKHTATKEACFGAVLAYDIKRYSDESRNLPYIHVDLNAGSGENKRVGCVGTPGLLMRQLQKRRVCCRAYFCEKNAHSMEQLRTDLALNGSLFEERNQFHFIAGDNADFLCGLPGIIEGICFSPRLARGCIIADPNGVSRERGGFPLPEIGEVARKFPNMIVLIHWFYAGAIRVNGWNASNQDRTPMSTFVLDDILGAIPRRHWLCAEPFGGRTVLAGSNYFIPEMDHPRLTILTRDLAGDISGESGVAHV